MALPPLGPAAAANAAAQCAEDVMELDVVRPRSAQTVDALGIVGAAKQMCADCAHHDALLETSSFLLEQA